MSKFLPIIGIFLVLFIVVGEFIWITNSHGIISFILRGINPFGFIFGWIDLIAGNVHLF